MIKRQNTIVFCFVAYFLVGTAFSIHSIPSIQLRSCSYSSMNRISVKSCSNAGQGSTSLFMRSGYYGTPERQRKKPSPFTATNLLIGLNVGMFLMQQIFPSLKMDWMKYDRMIDRGEIHRFFTGCLLHGDIGHLLMNCYSLYNLGPQTSKLLGTARFVTAYFASGILANIGTYLVRCSPASVGASGCIFGLLGTFGMYYIRNKKILGAEADAGLESIKQTLFFNFMFSVASRGVDNGGHIGGFLAGALFTFLFGPYLKKRKNKKSGRIKIIDEPVINYVPIWNKLRSVVSQDEEDEQNMRPSRRW